MLTCLDMSTALYNEMQTARSQYPTAIVTPDRPYANGAFADFLHVKTLLDSLIAPYTMSSLGS